MAVSSVLVEAQSGLAENAQVTSSSGTTETGDLVTGTANGRRIKEISIMSGQYPPAAGTVVVVKLYNGSSSRALRSFVCDGQPDSLQIVLPFNNFLLPSTSHSIRAQCRTALPTNATLDFVFIGENF